MSLPAPLAGDCGPAKKLALHTPSSCISAKNFARHARKHQFWAIFRTQGELFRAHAPAPGRAGRQISHTGHSHVATMQPMTPLQPLIQASVKPPSPMLAPEQQALKPATPLQPKNARKRPFLARKGDGGFSRGSADARKGDDGFRQPGRLVYRAWLRCPWAVAGPGLPQKSHAIRLDEDSITSENVAISTL